MPLNIKIYPFLQYLHYSGLRDVRLQFSHSQSFYESHKPVAVRVTGGPLTNGHPVVKTSDKCTCNYCELKFLNDAALVAHEIRCSKFVSFFIFVLFCGLFVH